MSSAEAEKPAAELRKQDLTKLYHIRSKTIINFQTRALSFPALSQLQVLFSILFTI